MQIDIHCAVIRTYTLLQSNEQKFGNKNLLPLTEFKNKEPYNSNKTSAIKTSSL